MLSASPGGIVGRWFFSGIYNRHLVFGGHFEAEVAPSHEATADTARDKKFLRTPVCSKGFDI
ncbi:MAG TPA: hypothetical protein DCS43_11045 [Verrucomicrobia bacterium]|nr:hypothetical protein [Verrucomicrobiota bacterium]